MEKGTIIYFDPKARKQSSTLTDKKHPIVCLEDVSAPSEHFHSVILSSHIEPNESHVKNIMLNADLFENGESYSVPGDNKEEYLVGLGIWKDIEDELPAASGKIKIKGLNRILLELLGTINNDDVQEKLYQDLIRLVKDYNTFYSVDTDIKTFLNNHSL